ncbi:hypothetical protein PVK06_016966 [Gossypium arboreum]|uniref:Uncharacterized protein n=1 Tax=Gossypium arboreum TaxID=29729 RepID=A0ABR0Q2K8_GOSAR|nr:hypothetical protein PVK06_016966 [Gossypium arboreum]
MELNLRNQQAVKVVSGVIWPCLFGIVIWRLWKSRNLRIFQGLSWSTGEVIKTSLCWAKQYVSVSRSKGTKPSWSDLIPDSLDGWVYLYTDGSVKYEDMFAAVGGLLRDQKGTGIIRYTRKFLSEQTILKRLTSFMKEFGKALILP